MALPVLATKDFQRTTFKPRHRPIVRAVAEALFAPEGDASEERLEQFVDEVDAFISPASKTLRFGFVAMLFVLRWSPFFFLKLRTFDELSIDERVHHLERLDQSKVKQLPLIVVAFKTVMSMLWYEDEKELVGLGYPGHDRKRYLKVVTVGAATATSPSAPSPSRP